MNPDSEAAKAVREEERRKAAHAKVHAMMLSRAERPVASAKAISLSRSYSHQLRCLGVLMPRRQHREHSSELLRP